VGKASKKNRNCTVDEDFDDEKRRRDRQIALITPYNLNKLGLQWI
tara:strand:+ start:238 stop:372 length:135 start_codon:yes stop_codon:yes gene_type:complete